jgi:prolyl 4-hydroxylase
MKMKQNDRACDNNNNHYYYYRHRHRHRHRPLIQQLNILTKNIFVIVLTSVLLSPTLSLTKQSQKFITGTTNLIIKRVKADALGNPEVDKDPRTIENWIDYREHFLSLNEDVQDRTLIADGNTPWIEHVSWEPRIYVYHNFLSEKETKHLRDEYKKKKNENDMFEFKRGHDEIVNKIEQRLSAFIMLPETHGENMFIEKTKNGYAERLEIFDENKDGEALKNGGQRFATTALFLNTISEGKGGELVFPKGTERLFDDSNSYNSNPSACAEKYKIFVEPRAGDAVLWFGTKHNGNDDLTSASMRCDAIVEGEELFTAYKRWRVGRYNHGNFLPKDDVDVEASNEF